MDYTTTATNQNNNQNKRTNLCKVITKKAIREFLPKTERGRDIEFVDAMIPALQLTPDLNSFFQFFNIYPPG